MQNLNGSLQPLILLDEIVDANSHKSFSTDSNKTCKEVTGIYLQHHKKVTSLN
jgi:hypothetical protein